MCRFAPGEKQRRRPQELTSLVESQTLWPSPGLDLASDHPVINIDVTNSPNAVDTGVPTALGTNHSVLEANTKRDDQVSHEQYNLYLGTDQPIVPLLGTSEPFCQFFVSRL